MRIAVNVAIVLVMTGLFIMKERSDQARAYEAQRANTVLIVNELVDNISEKMNRILLVGGGFAAAMTLKPDIDQDDFAAYAATVLRSEKALVNAAVVRDDRIDFVYPYDQNKHLIGADLSTVPDQKAALDRARDTRRSVFQGPVALLQGFDGYILREPIFQRVDGQLVYWGAMSMVFSNKFLDGLGIEKAQVQYDVAIRSPESAQLVIGDAALFAQDTVRRSVDVPGARWQVAAVPREGWIVSAHSADLFLIYTAVTAFSLLIANLLFNQRAKALRSSEQLHAAIDVLYDGFVLFDADDRLIVCNQRYRDMYAASAPAIYPGAKFEDILRYGLEHGQYDAAKGREEEWFAERVEAHRQTNYTLEQQLNQGLWLRVREMETPDGGRVGIRVDITEQVVSRQRALVAETRLRDAIEAVPASFWLFDPDEQLELLNGRALQSVQDDGSDIAVGLTLEEFVATIVSHEVPGYEGEEADRRQAHLLRQLRTNTAEFELHLGEDSWFKYLSHRTAEGGTVCFGVDVSELMLHERWLQQSNTRLRDALKERDAAESRLADVADISNEWFWEQDDRMRVTFVSPGFERATGIPAADLIGKKRSELIIEDAGFDSGDKHTIAERIGAREAFRGYIYQANLTPGVETWLRTSGKPIYDDNGVFRGYIGTAADVTQLYSALRDAKRADEAKTQFLNVISHELRTPMTIVLGFNAFLLSIENLPEFRQFRKTLASIDDPALEAEYVAAVSQVRRFSEKIQAAGDQLQNLIQDMLDLARIEANTMHINARQVRASPVVDSIIDQMQPLAKEKGIRIVGEVEDVDVKCDETRLRQILINLIANAIKFTDTGSITVRTEDVDGMIAFTVEDTGIGIPQEAIPTIFERFTQVDISSTRNKGGAGLGLSISKELIRLQGGTISATSEQGKGTKIRFTIPRWEAVEVA
jgi:PAS domain S-box-containing protein